MKQRWSIPLLFLLAALGGLSALRAGEPTLQSALDLLSRQHFPEAISQLELLAVRNASDLMRYARNNPGKVSYASNGVGSIYHLAGAMMKLLTGLELVHVPYKGGAQMMPDLIAGQVQMSFASLISVPPQLKSGKVRLIAVLEPSRYAALPDVPALAESIPEFGKPPTWLGLFGPANLPGPVLARLNAAMVKIVMSDEVRAQLENNGFAVIANTPEQFAAAIRSDMEYVARIVKAAGIQPE